MSASKEAEYFSDGITEEIINALAKIQDLKVTSRTSSFSFKGTNKSISEIANKLKVAIILEGSVRLSGNTVRITAQLIDVEEDFHFWSETFDRTLENIFAVQDEVSIFIADKLREHIGHFDLEDHLVDNFDISLESYKKYLMGRYYLMKLDVSNTMKGIGILKEVVGEEPQFPLAYLDINQGYMYLGTMGLIPSGEAFVHAKPFLDKAIDLGENLPETQLNLSWISCWQNRDLSAAYKHLNKALSIRPTDNMYLTMANFLTLECKLDVAMKYIEKALDLAPFSSVNLNYKGFLFYMMENYEEALPYFKRSLDIQPDLPFPVMYIGASYLLMGNHLEGLSYFNELPGNETNNITKLGGQTIAHAMMGDFFHAEKGITKLERFLDTDLAGNAINFLILCHVQMDRIDVALDYLKKGVDFGAPLIPLLATEPLAKKLHKLTSFQTLMAKSLDKKGDFNEPKRKYKKSLINPLEIRKFCKQVDEVMQKEELFLNPDLSLRGLAQLMNLPTNHMSQLLNEGFQKNFADYVNSYRLEAFKIKITDPNLRHLTILALAYESGFNSKTVFNTFFKKKIGLTPKAYLNQLKN